MVHAGKKHSIFKRSGLITWLLLYTLLCRFESPAQVLNVTQAGVIEGGYGVTPNLFGASSVFVAGNYAYVVGTGDVLEIIDVTLPGLPQHKGSLANGVGGASILRPQSVMVQGNYAYITSYGSNTLEIVDVSNPAQPVHKGLIKDGGGNPPYLKGAWGLYVSGNYAYVTGQLNESFEIIDISDPSSPVHVAGLLNGGGNPPILNFPISVKVAGNYAYVGGSLGFEVIDITDPYAPLHAGSLMNGGGGVPPFLVVATSISISGNYAYVSDISGALEIIDISNPALPTHVGSLQNGAGAPPYLPSPFCAAVSGSHAYMVNYSGANGDYLEVIDISDPTAPVHEASLKDPIFSNSRSIVISGNYAFVTSRINNSLGIVDISNPSAPFIKSSIKHGTGGPLLANPFSVFVSNGFAYIASEGNNALEIVNVSNPFVPTHQGSITHGTGSAQLDGPESVHVVGNYAYVASRRSNSLEIINVSNPTFPVRSGGLIDGSGGAILNEAHAVYVANNTAYVLSRDALEIIDVTNPAAPVHKGNLANGVGGALLKAPMNIFVDGNFAYVADSASHALEIIDISDPALPVHAGNIIDGGGTAPYLEGAYSVFVKGNYAYVVSYLSNTLEIIDISDPANPLHAASLLDGNGVAPYLKKPKSIYVSDNTAFIAQQGGLEVVDITDPVNPIHQTSLLHLEQGALLDNPFSVFVAGNYIYMANSAIVVNGSTIGLFNNLNIAYQYGPSLNDFNPKSGPVGTTVTISGTNFNTFISAKLNGLNAPITDLTENSFKITIPDGATIGHITVNYFGLSISGDQHFLVTPTAMPATSLQQTSFTASWSDVKATNYFIDVSDDGFKSFAGSYDNFPIGAVSNYTITGLKPGVDYQYRVRSSDGNGISTNSNEANGLTIPGTPAGIAASAVSQTGFTANWTDVAGSTGYYLDVGLDKSFKSQLAGYSNLLVQATFKSISGLEPGTKYYYRVRSANASGQSPSSKVISLTTIPSSPNTLEATDVVTRGFTANWSAVAGATGYYVDLSLDNFISYVKGYNNLDVGNSNSVLISKLSSSTTYQYRVRAYNDAGVSGNSNATAVLTLTLTPNFQPTNLLFTSATANSINLSYSVATGNPAGYIVLRSSFFELTALPENGTVYSTGELIGNAAIAYVGPALSFFDGGLPTSTTYYYSVFSYNGFGNGIIYLMDNPLTGNVTLDIEPPVISPPPIPNPVIITAGNTPVFEAVITDNVEVETAEFYYRGISHSTFNHAPMTPLGVDGFYSIQIQSEWYDSLGLEYYFAASDQNGNATVKPTSTNYCQLITPSITLPTLPFGSDQSNYRIIAFPYLLNSDNKVTSVYGGVPWNDNSKSSLWWWNPVKNDLGAYDRYGDLSSFQTVDPGKGYWAITFSPVTPQLSNVKAPKYNRSNLYSMTLKPDWNQIGNPYPFPISWDDVIAINQAENPSATFSQLNVYDGEGYKSATGDVLLNAFEGGFVKNLSSSDITIVIPFPKQTSTGGRVSQKNIDISDQSWNVFMHISQHGFKNQLGGFGMHPMASEEGDRFDNYNPPAFFESPEINFSNAGGVENSQSFDMVPTRPTYQWQFTAAGQIGDEMVLNWNPDLKSTGTRQLFLFDEERIVVIDMMKESSYRFTLSKRSKFTVFYGDNIESKVRSADIVSGAPYPNPLTDETASINISLPDAHSSYMVRVELMSMQGEIMNSGVSSYTPGIHALRFNLTDDRYAPGVYLYKLFITGERNSRMFIGKLIKP